MKHLIALILKFIIAAVIFEIYMLFVVNIGFWHILLLSAIVTGIAYLIGDLIILPHANNIVAALVDIVLAFFTVFIFRYIKGYEFIRIIDAIIIAILLGISEWFFHKYMADRVLKEEEK